MNKIKKSDDVIESTTALAAVGTTDIIAATPGRVKYKISKSITVPTISFKNRDSIAFKCMEKIRIGKQIDDQKDPASLMRIIDLDTGELLDLIVNTVLMDTLINYGTYDGEYVGRMFVATATQVTGKKYKNFTVSEIELDE